MAAVRDFQTLREGQAKIPVLGPLEGRFVTGKHEAMFVLGEAIETLSPGALRLSVVRASSADIVATHETGQG